MQPKPDRMAKKQIIFSQTAEQKRYKLPNGYSRTVRFACNTLIFEYFVTER